MAARGNRDAMVVGTKVAGPYQDVPGGLRATDVASECEKSLRRLQTSTIDLYYAHIDDWATPGRDPRRFRGAPAVRQDQVGRPEQLAAAALAEARLLAEIDGWPVAALEYRHTSCGRRPTPTSPADRRNTGAVRLRPGHGLTVVAYSVLLNGAYARPDRSVPWSYRGPDTDARLACLREVAAELGTTPDPVVFAWLQTTPGCTVIPIIGGSTLEQVQQNLQAATVRLSRDQRDRLNAAGAPHPDGEGETP